MGRNKKLSTEIINEIKDAYATREFSMNELAGQFGVSVSAISKAIHSGYVPKPKGITETMERTEQINEHIMSSFDDDIEALIGTINANMYGNRTLKQACDEVVQGGCFLCYFTQVNEFLKELNCQLSDNDQTNWSMYKKLLVQRMEKLYKDYKTNGGN